MSILKIYLQKKIKKISEYDRTNYLGLTLWEAKGNDHILAVSYVLKKDDANYDSRLKALTESSNDFGLCDEILNGSKVLYIEVIIPFEDSDRAYALYGTSKGLNGSRH